MAKKRKISYDDDDSVQGDSQQMSCTTLDHVYPAGPKVAGVTTCFCGKRQFRPLIQLDDYLKAGMLIRTYPDGPLYEVEMVNKSRARCRIVKVQELLNRRKEDQRPVFMPMPGMPVDPETGGVMVDDEEEEKRGRIINISPRSAVQRVSHAELEEETQTIRRSDMAVKAGIPVAGNGKVSNKDANKARLAKLAAKPGGSARPLTGAAAKAKAAARPKVAKTVRECGCGCKGETMSYFIPGHDARFKGWMKKTSDGRMSLDELKKVMGQKQFGKYTFKKSGDGFVTKTTYQEAAEA